MFILQFRQSIKRIFVIHTKAKNSTRTEKYDNTVMSPAHRMSSLNNIRMNSTDGPNSQISKVKDKKVVFTDEALEVANIAVERTVIRNPELKTIQENKTSDTERSGETIYNDDSSSQNKLDLFGASCKIINEQSPVLTFMDNERLLFSKIRLEQDEENVYGTGNDAYEVHPTDEISKDTFATNREYSSFLNQKILPQSFSLDLSRYSLDSECKKRKMSVETKLESAIQSRGFFKESISKLFEPNSKLNKDCVKSYLCDRNDKANNEEL